MSDRGRGVLWKIFNGIRRSFENRESKNPYIFKGQDGYGNRYFESDSLNPLGKKTRISQPPKEVDRLNILSPEWEAWLRHRRDDPPSTEEVSRNLEAAKIRKQKADERLRTMLRENKEYVPRAREIRRQQDEREMHNPFNASFPRYPDLEESPSSEKKEDH
ncbi:uncharacterized protein LOC141856042 [Brevipalpus obovatus]|uniref:uncharacterized protein LOC141856042 n=1 Tax=Brevipalpus obovatus TaxID=246614 RepID=UPI003D9F7AA5